MNPDQYAAQQAVITGQVLNYIRQLSKFFTRPALSVQDWLRLLQILFPEVQRQREASAALARVFYDSQRASAHPKLPRQDRVLEGTDWKTFVHSMEPARARMSQADSGQDAVTQLALQAVKEVENAGRRQIIHAVEDDQATIPAPASSGSRQVRGWARVATGRETCAWCLMLVSRGPVYSSAEAAGLHLDNQSAMIAAGTDVRENMDQWHPGCDCIVVPVYKNEGWVGEAAQKRALELWNEATLEANRIQDENPSIHPSGKDKGRQMTLNQEALNALRRRLSSGDISQSEWAALSAA